MLLLFISDKLPLLAALAPVLPTLVISDLVEVDKSMFISDPVRLFVMGDLDDVDESIFLVAAEEGSGVLTTTILPLICLISVFTGGGSAAASADDSILDAAEGMLLLFITVLAGGNSVGMAN